jgi:hypothetical protein
MNATVEAILTETGKAFRLCRFYPASHPAVQQAMASVSATLPALARSGAAEIKITPTGFLVGSQPVAARNKVVQEFAGLLYTQGHRLLHLEPGVTPDEVAALIRAVTSSGERAMRAIGGASVFEQLPHIRLERSSPKTPKQAPVERGSMGAGAPVLGRRSISVFRPDALPPEIEVNRLAAQLAQGGDQAAAAGRLAELLPEIALQHDFRTLAVAVRALDRVASGADAAAADFAGQALQAGIGDAAVSGLVSRLGDAALPPAERDEAVQAVAALGPRAMGMIGDAFMVATDQDQRDILLAVVRRAGAAAVEPLLSRANPDARGETARAYVQLLGATNASGTALILGVFAQHAEAAVRQAAIAALARIEDPEAVRLTVGALRDRDPRVRQAAAHGIARFGTLSSSPVVIAVLEEEADDAAAVAMVEALGELRDPRAVSVLAAMADGVSGIFQRHATSVRVAAVRALGAIGTSGARDALIPHVRSGRPEVREAAARALTG